jgi:hypothetical protein
MNGIQNSKDKMIEYSAPIVEISDNHPLNSPAKEALEESHSITSNTVITPGRTFEEIAASSVNEGPKTLLDNINAPSASFGETICLYKPSTPQLERSEAEQINSKNLDLVSIKDETANRVERIMGLLKINENVAINNSPKPSIDSTSVFDGVKVKIHKQQLEIEEKTQTIQLLRQKLGKLKQAHSEQIDQQQQMLKSQLNLQRKEYEAIVKRHLTFIDKVMKEKETLMQKCTLLTDQVKSLEKDFLSKNQSLQDSHARELKGLKEVWLQQEKLKREKWIQEKTKTIKEATIKGLEPEIQQLISQQKAQLAMAEENYQQQLVKEKAILMDNHQRSLVFKIDTGIHESEVHY